MTPHSPNDPGTESEPGAGKPAPEGTVPGPMSMCPMAESCRGMATKSFPKFLLALPGLLFIAAGVLILLIPALLFWFTALAAIAMGIMMLIFASFMIRMRDRFRHTQP